jgi:hypothetical protein
LSTTPWIQANIVDRFSSKDNKDAKKPWIR